MCLAVPGQIIDITGEDPLLRTGLIDFSGVRKSVSLAYIPEASIGDWAIVHAGFAIAQIDEEEAQATLATFEELDASVAP